MRVLMIFLDGVGVGPADEQSNPFMHANLPTISALLDGRTLVDSYGTIVGDHAGLMPADATLGVPGLPQSGTGQTALMTGVNAPDRIGKHEGPYPSQDMLAIIRENSIFERLKDKGTRVSFANAYPDRYLDRMERGTGRTSAVARSAHAAGVRLRGPEDLQAGRAVSAFLTNQGWVDHLGYDGVKIISAYEAGRRLIKIAEDYDFTLFEYYQTDMVGHRGIRARILDVLEQIDSFLRGVLDNLAPAGMTVLITSDHGNIEDWGTTDHTYNPALCMSIGLPKITAHLAANIRKTTDIASNVVDLVTALTVSD